MPEQYADIIVDISHEKLDRPFQYRVPAALRDRLEPGMCVEVPFGNGNRRLKGYVLRVGTECAFDPARTKEILQIAEKDADATGKLVELAAWMRRQYGSTMIQALKTVLPAKRSVQKLSHKYVRILMNREELRSLLGESMRRKQTAKVRLLTALLEQSSEQELQPIPYAWIVGKLHVSASTVNSLVKAGAIQVLSTEEYRNPVRIAGGKAPERNRLSEDQQTIVDTVLADFDRGDKKCYLLHGITGSGKTEVYMALIEAVVERGYQAIVLIPEIALTYQTLMRFYGRFGDRVSVINSNLSAGEKYDQCERAKRGEIDVIIGPRSALFTPFARIGLIVMDEEHEGSYKSENAPKYHAREVAIRLAKLHGASVLFGSATPSLEAYAKAEQGEYQLFTLTKRLTGGTLPHVSVVDLRQELASGNRSIFSMRLQTLLADRLQKGQQSMLFLNRRGYAGFVSCRGCGYVMKCPHCDVSLSEHGNGRLMCHYCGYSAPKPKVCPSCGSKYILGFRAGTQQIEEKLRELFPTARILRMDRDTTRTKDSYTQILSAFANEEADVLIGTQMIVKGHDFPKVTLVGVLAADLSLSAGDFRSGERTFQLLTQAVGRAGRGSLPGEAVIQTYQPEHYAITYAAAQDYEGFYREELLYRELGGYPPAAHMLAVQVFSGEEQAGMQLAGRLAAQIDKSQVQVLGPAPATIGKLNDVYRTVLYVKSADYAKLIQVKDVLEAYAAAHAEEKEQVQFDFDPMNCI
ncbi:MAG: primosomal protein N' [Lachnospiraceae bacterium]|nr:primosomal protein N' [Lachnospiraceae bacterium]